MKRNSSVYASQFATAVFLVITVLMAPGCASVQNKNTVPGETGSRGLILCPEPRPEICTQEYRPVCAQLSDDSFGEYANWCTACADGDVVGYREGNCVPGE